MDKYRAISNDVDQNNNLDDSDKSENEKKQESTEKAVDLAGEVALDYFTGGQGSKVLKSLEKTPIVGNHVKNKWDDAVKNVSNFASKTPLGDVAKEMDESGVTDTLKGVKNIYDVSNGGSLEASGGSYSDINNVSQNNINLNNGDKSLFSGNTFKNLFKSNNEETKNNVVGNLPQLFNVPFTVKIYIAIGLGVFIFLMLFVSVFADENHYNLKATNDFEFSNQSNGSSGNIPLSEKEIEDRLIYVGDSRVVGMESTLNNGNIKFIGKVSSGYKWLTSEASNTLDNVLKEKTDGIIILAHGINDYYNTDKYIEYYKELIAKYPNNNIFILSINPIDEALARSKGYQTKTSEIEKFNAKMKEAFPDIYIDTYSKLTNISTSDGIHYNNSTNNEIHNLILSELAKTGKFKKNSSAGDISLCSMTVIGDKYYKTLVPQTKDCRVHAFPDNSWGLEPNFYNNVMLLIEDGKANGCSASIISGHRTYEKQQQLYERYKNQPGRAAKPGKSNHEYGIAADLSYSPATSKCKSYYHNAASKYGLVFPLLKARVREDWHVEPINIIKGSP